MTERKIGIGGGDIVIWSQVAIAVFGGLSTFAGAVALIVGLITNTQKFKTWHTERLKRNKNLDRLAERADDIQSLIDNQYHIHEMYEKLENIEKMVDKTSRDNGRQDRQIMTSLEERELLMYGVMAILDWAIDNGANGTAHNAREQIRKYKYAMSHRFDEYDTEG